MHSIQAQNHDSLMASNDFLRMHERAVAWQTYVQGIDDWQSLIHGCPSRVSGCGVIYELPSLLGRDDEFPAIADMRSIQLAQPHYHPAGNWEWYVVLQGTATVVVGTKEYHVKRHDIVMTPPLTAHFTIPDKDFVLLAVHAPSFKPGDYIPLEASNPAVHFDRDQLRRLVDRSTSAGQ